MGIRILIALVLALALIPFAHSLAISDVKVLKTTSTSATISWQTDDPSSGRVRYGLTSSLGFSSVHQELRTNHTILLSGLLSGRTYSFEVASALFDGNEVTDDNEDALYTLTTKDVIPPSKVSGLKVLFSTPSSIGLGWDPSSTGDISHYLIYENRILLANVSASQNPSFNHTSIIQGATYSYKVSAVDTSLNEGQLSDTLSITSEKEDSTLPRLLGVDFENATDTSVQVNILTDKETTAHIRHGILTLTDFESDDRFLTTHSFELSNLRKNTTYQVSIEMCDRFNNCLISNTTYRAGRDFGEQFINASLPRFWSRRTIDIFGSTKPYSEVSLYVNNLNLPLRFLGSSDTGPSGIISFRGIFLNQENVIKLVSKNKLGQSKETLFEVNVDTDSPVVAFKTIADVTSRKNLTIEGSTNEPVIIRAYVRSSKEKATTPKNLSGFRNDSISPNAVTLKWNAVNDPDFSHYILRRSDVGAIAIIQPSSYTAYTDILADAGRTYTYTLSYMNEFGKESAQTPPVIATMPSSGIVLGIKPSLVDIMQDFRKPTKQIEVNASGAFTLSFIVGSQDGAYDVKLEAIDRAGNRMGVEKEVLLDTKIPEIKITSPPNNAVVFESYANSIDIKGVTEPNTRVHLFVGRTPFNMANLTFDISGLKKDIEDLPETSLDADCKAIIRSKDMCGTNADFSTTSDSQGNFQFEGVDATSLFSAAGSLQEVDEKDFSASNTNIKQSRKAKFVVIATDRSGLRNAVQSELSIGTCWSGNLSWDVIPLSEYQSPTLISTERLTENTESIYFYFNYSYIGPSTSGTRKIKSVTLTKACGTKEVLDPRFNISCQILPSGAQAIKVNPEGTVSYSAIKLNSIKGMDRWLSGEWKDFFSTINKELSFPFKVTITYEHEINGRKTQDVQTTCQEVTYVLDNSRIDPREVLPDWLLYDFVDYLNESLFTIRQVQEQIDAIMPYVATGCLASYVSNFGTQVYRRWVEIFEEKKWLVKEFTDSFWDTSFGSNPNKEHCKTLIQGMIASKAYGKPFRLSYLSDSDLEKCFPPAYSAWKAEEATYKAYRYACDRLFGHTTPAYWTRDKTDSQLLNKVSSGSACANDQTAYGQRLRKVKCADISSSYASDTPYSRDAECLEVTSTLSSTISPTSSSRVSGLYAINPVPVDPNTKLYEATLIRRAGSLKESIYVVKASDKGDYYITAQQKTCADVCGIRNSATKTLDISGKSVTSTYSRIGKTETDAVCTTSQSCIDLNAKVNQLAGSAQVEGYQYNSEDGKSFTVSSAKRKGFTSNCFYSKGDPDLGNPSVVSDDLRRRMECCCIVGKDSPTIEYYDASDTYLDRSLSSEKVHKPADTSAQTTASSLSAGAQNQHVPLEWSYRYWKAGFISLGQDNKKHLEYNKLRFVEGRDNPACFGSLTDFAFGPDTLIIDPNRRYFLEPLLCANLGGIQQRLTVLSNILSSMQTCLMQVRTTGRADTGVCKEVFTQYVCSAAWDAIQFAQWTLNGFDNCKSSAIEVDGNSNYDALDTIKGTIKGVTDTLSDKQGEFMNEYGNAKLNDMLGGGAEATARKVCLAAFGYDWPLDAKSLLDASYAQPFATLVQVVTASREYLTVNPNSKQGSYEYRGSWIINPGCDFANYKVELACIGRDTLDADLGADCTKQNSPDGTNCPCLDSGEKTMEFFTDSRPVKQNQLVDRNSHKVATSNFRYDHFKITLRPNQKIDKSIRSRCYPTGYDAGVFYAPITDRTAHDIATCRIEPISGVLMCDGGADFFSKSGFAYMSNIRINEMPIEQVKELAAGDSLRLSADIFKTGSDKCLLVTIDKPTTNRAFAIRINGTEPFNAPIIDTIKINGAVNVVPPRGFQTSLVQSQNLKSISIPIYATDHEEEPQGGKIDTSSGFGRLSKGDLIGFSKGRTIEVGTNDEYIFEDLRMTTSEASNDVLVESQGTVIRILGISFYNSQNQYIKSKERIETIVVPSPSTLNTESQQTMNVRLGLYNLRGNAQDFTSANDCNINEPALDPNGGEQKKTYSILIRNSITPGQIGGFGPSITGPIINPTRYTPGQDVKVTITATKRDSSMQFESADLILSWNSDSDRIPMGIENTLNNEMSVVYTASIPNNRFQMSGLYKISGEVKYRPTSNTPDDQLSSASSSIQTFNVPPN